MGSSSLWQLGHLSPHLRKLAKSDRVEEEGKGAKNKALEIMKVVYAVLVYYYYVAHFFSSRTVILYLYAVKGK